jgi:hypothetical protein
MYARMQAAFLTRPTTGTVRETRTTPLRDDRAVSLYIKPTPASPLVEEPRQVPWLAYFIGLSAILALVNAFIYLVTPEAPHYSTDKAVAQVQKEQYVHLPKLLPPWHWELLPFSLSTDAQGRPSFWVKARDKGIVKGESDLPKTGEMGDEYFSADGTVGWVWMLPTGAKEPCWVDP